MCVYRNDIGFHLALFSIFYYAVLCDASVYVCFSIWAFQTIIHYIVTIKYWIVTILVQLYTFLVAFCSLPICSQTNPFANCVLCFSFHPLSLYLFLHSTNHFLYYCLITNWNVPTNFDLKKKQKNRDLTLCDPKNICKSQLQGKLCQIVCIVFLKENQKSTIDLFNSFDLVRDCSIHTRIRIEFVVICRTVKTVLPREQKKKTTKQKK